jgi:hypothetical protein
MALLLVMAVNHTHVDSVKDQRGCYKRGDIVAVYDDDKHDGDLVANPIQPPFVLIRVTGVTADQVRQYVAQELDAQSLPVRRRLFRLRVDDLPAGVIAQLQANRYYETTAAIARQFIRNKVTNLDEG